MLGSTHVFTFLRDISDNEKKGKLRHSADRHRITYCKNKASTSSSTRAFRCAILPRYGPDSGWHYRHLFSTLQAQALQIWQCKHHFSQIVKFVVNFYVTALYYALRNQRYCHGHAVSPSILKLGLKNKCQNKKYSMRR